MTDTSTKLHRVFVYGTLKRALHNHHLLESADYIGPAYTIDKFRMYTTGFPVLFESDHPDAKSVIGEVYDVDDQTLKRLDQLEGADRPNPMYNRKQINVVMAGQTLTGHDIVDANVHVYIGNDDYWKGHNLPEYTNTNAHDELDWRP